jgi:energy-coupling factor transporter transmembrane protein EcfT
MGTSSSPMRAYRRLGYLAVAHAIAVLLLGVVVFSTSIVNGWLPRLWVAVVTLWFFWPVVLALHRGRSPLRFALFISLAAVLLFPGIRLYNMIAPQTFGLPWGIGMNPLSVWKYFSAYRTGRADAEKDISAGILAIEESGLGAGTGHSVRLLRERYGIEIRAIAGCIVNENILGHEAGYNAVSEAEIERRIGSNRIAAVREEGHRLDVQDRAREEQYFKDLAKRLSSFSADSKIALESVRPYADGHSEIAPEAEEEVAQFVQAVEEFIVEAIPEDAPAFHLRVSARLTPTERPKFETSASLSSPRPVYLKIYNGLPNLPLPKWNRGQLSLAMDFAIRQTP